MYHGGKKAKPKSEHASPDIESKEELKMEHIPKKTKRRLNWLVKVLSQKNQVKVLSQKNQVF